MLWTAVAVDGVTRAMERKGRMWKKKERDVRNEEERRRWWRREGREENEAERGWISAGPLSRRVPLHVCTTNAYALLLRTILRCRVGSRGEFDGAATVCFQQTNCTLPLLIIVAQCDRKCFSRVLKNSQSNCMRYTLTFIYQNSPYVFTYQVQMVFPNNKKYGSHNIFCIQTEETC